MRKNTTLPLVLLLLLLCGCGGNDRLNSQTRFLMDTAAKIAADCGDETLNGAFDLCERLDRTLSRTNKESDVYKLNSSDGFVTVSDDTLKITERALYYSDLSDGKFDITICPVSELWDFKEQVIPDRSEIAEALKSVDYHSVEIKDGKISLGGKKIDLGSVAKGYAADRVTDYFKAAGVKRALINLGGNVSCIGSFTVGIKKPFDDEVALTVRLEDKSAVTSGIYERYIEKDGEIYHHVLDPKTGYGVKNELASVTVIGGCSLDCDALSTVCLLSGTQKGTEIIENSDGFEAVFIDRNGGVTLTSGLYRENNEIIYKR